MSQVSTVYRSLATIVCLGVCVCAPKKCTVAEANELIEKYIFSINPGMNERFKADLREYADDDLSKMSVQIYKNKTTPYENWDFLIYNKEVIQLGNGYGGFGVTSYCVSDLNNDNDYEVVYAYNYGSGIPRTSVGLWSKNLSSQGLFFAYRGTLKLKKSIEGRVFIYDAYYDTNYELQSSDTIVGEIVLRKNNGRYGMDIIYNEDVNDGIKWKIWVK